MLRAALIDTLGDPSERRYMVTIMSDSDPASLSITGTDVIGMEDGDIVATGSQIITPTDGTSGGPRTVNFSLKYFNENLYVDSGVVQPKSFKVFMWRRTA